MLAVILANPAENVVYKAGGLQEELHLQKGFAVDYLRDLDHKALTKEFVKKFPLVNPSGYSARTMATQIASLDVLELELDRQSLPQLMSQSPRLQPQPSRSTCSTVRATLVVCPASCVNVWLDQIESHVAKDTLRVYAYRGSQRIRSKTFLENQDIILVSYQLLAREYKQLLQDRDGDEDEASADVSLGSKQDSSLLCWDDKKVNFRMSDNACKLEDKTSTDFNPRDRKQWGSNKSCDASYEGKETGGQSHDMSAADCTQFADSGILSVKYHRIVLDECHYIRNNCQARIYL